MRKLALACGSFSAAVFLAVYLIPDPWICVAAACMFLAALAAPLLRGGRRRWLILMLSAAVGFLWTWAHAQLVLKPSEELAGQTKTAVGVVTDFPEHYEYGSRLYVRLKGWPGTRAMIYSYDYDVSELRPGDRIEACVRFASAQQLYGGQTDRYTAKGIFIRGYLESEPKEAGRSAFAVLMFPRSLALAVRQMVDRCFPEDSAALMKALMTGDKKDLYEQQALYDDMSVAGLQHVAAVSGMHVAFLVSMVQYLVGRRRTALLGIPAVLVFMFMAGGSPSVVRAAFMQICLLLAAPLNREADPPTSLAAVLALLLLLNPASIASVSLQLSFASVAGIQLITPRVYDGLIRACKAEKRKGFVGKLLRFVISSVSGTLGAIIFTTPIAAIHFGSISLLSPLTNLLCLLPVSLCFSCGWAVCLLGAIYLPLGQAAGWLVAWPLRWVMLVVKLIAKVPFAAVYTCGNFISWWLICAYFILFITYIGRGNQPWRPVLPICLCVTTLSGIMMLNAMLYNSGTRMTVLNVGQGQSISLFSGKSTAVIDCGNLSSADDAGALMSDYLHGCGRRRVDVLILTHLHEDHADGAARLIRRMSVRNVILPTMAQDTSGLLDEILEAAEEQGAEVYQLATDAQLQLGQTTVKLFLAGSTDDLELAVLVTKGECDVLVTGDISTAAERALVARTDLPDCEALVVGHHGSKNATSQELLEAIKPEIALISVGFNNYGHPAPEILQRLEDFGTSIYRTDEDGNLVVRLD